MKLTLPHKGIVLLLVAVSFLSYANALNNGFIGDDHYLFEGNRFYKNLANVSALFTSKAILAPKDLDLAVVGEREASGTMSYRPVTLLTFFTDYAFWKHNPFGFHLTNILLHVLNTLLAFFFVFLLVREKQTALLAALIFAAHPVHAEAVDSIGFRYDLTSTAFFLSAFIAYIKFTQVAIGTKSRWWLTLSYIFFFIGIFAKETLSTLPFMIILYDVMFNRQERFFEKINKRKFVYLGYFAILALYWYVYLFVFKTTMHDEMFAFKGKYYVPLGALLKIFFIYLKGLFVPWSVHTVAPQYAPSPGTLTLLELIAVLLVFSGIVYLGVKYFKKTPLVSFCALWFALTFIPTSNAIPLINPFAFRYLYLPSLGFCILAGIFIERLVLALRERWHTVHLGFILQVVLVLILMGITLIKNTDYKNDYSYLRAMIRNYPQSAKPYEELGFYHLKRGEYKEALVCLKRSRALPQTPFYNSNDYYVLDRLGRCYVDDPQTAGRYFKESIALRPDFAEAHVDLANAYIRLKKYSEALRAARQAIAIDSKQLLAYIFAVHSAIEMKKWEEAEALVQDALAVYPQSRHLLFLKKVVEQKADIPDDM